MRHTDHVLVNDIEMALRVELHLRHHIATSDTERHESLGWVANLTITGWPWAPDDEDDAAGMSFTLKTPVINMTQLRRWVAGLNLAQITHLLDPYLIERPSNHQLEFNHMLTMIDERLVEMDKEPSWPFPD